MRSPSRSGRAWVSLIAAIALVAVAVAYAVPAIQRLRDRANLSLCADHLRQIGVGLANYEKAGDGTLPLAATVDGNQTDLLNCLAAGHAVVDAQNYYCPAQRQSQFSCSAENFKAGRIGYYWYAASGVTSNAALSKFLRTGIQWPRELKIGMDAQSWVMSDIWISGLPTAHVGFRKGMNYLMLDGSVQFTAECPRQSFH